MFKSTVFKPLLWLGAFLLVGALLISCTHGPPFVRMKVENARAKPDSHVIAVAVHYMQLRDPTGFINTFPNGGVSKVLDKKVMIYLCNIDTLEVSRVAFISPPDSMKNSWSAWIIGWVGDSLYFKMTGKSGTGAKAMKEMTKIFYKVDLDGKLSEVQKVPEDIAFQHNSGPFPQGIFVRLSKGYSDINIKTETLLEYRTMFRTDSDKRALVAVKGSNKGLTSESRN